MSIDGGLSAGPAERIAMRDLPDRGLAPATLPVPGPALADRIAAVVGNQPIRDVVQVFVHIDRVDQTIERRRIVAGNGDPREFVTFGRRHGDLHDLREDVARRVALREKISPSPAVIRG